MSVYFLKPIYVLYLHIYIYTYTHIHIYTYTQYEHTHISFVLYLYGTYVQLLRICNVLNTDLTDLYKISITEKLYVFKKHMRVNIYLDIHSYRHLETYHLYVFKKHMYLNIYLNIYSYRHLERCMLLLDVGIPSSQLGNLNFENFWKRDSKFRICFIIHGNSPVLNFCSPILDSLAKRFFSPASVSSPRHPFLLLGIRFFSSASVSSPRHPFLLLGIRFFSSACVSSSRQWISSRISGALFSPTSHLFLIPL